MRSFQEIGDPQYRLPNTETLIAKRTPDIGKPQLSRNCEAHWLQPVVMKVHLPSGFGDTTPIKANLVETNVEHEIETWVFASVWNSFFLESERQDLPFAIWVYIGFALGLCSPIQSPI